MNNFEIFIPHPTWRERPEQVYMTHEEYVAHRDFVAETYVYRYNYEPEPIQGRHIVLYPLPPHLTTATLYAVFSERGAIQWIHRYPDHAEILYYHARDAQRVIRHPEQIVSGCWGIYAFESPSMPSPFSQIVQPIYYAMHPLPSELEKVAEGVGVEENDDDIEEILGMMNEIVNEVKC